MTPKNISVKSPKTFAEQVEILASRNLIIENKKWAEEVLSRVNYYRLSAYALPFKTGDRFNDGVTFGDIYELYEFDKKFRYLVLGLLGTIETAFRTQIAYVIGHKYGSVGHTEANNFLHAKFHIKIMELLNNEIERSNEVFVEHHKRKYGGQFPVWVAIELTSFGLLSRMFANLKNEDKAYISKTFYDIPHKYIGSWLHTLSTFRNICAHYGRTYNRPLSIKPILPKSDVKLGVSNERTFAVLLVMSRLIQDKVEWVTFVAELETLVSKRKTVDLTLMGFPASWKEILSAGMEEVIISEAAATQEIRIESP